MNTQTMYKADVNYQRVIPRDLFNESKLLKCIGRLCLLIHDNSVLPCEMSFDEDIESFEIGLLDEGALTVANLEIRIKGIAFLFATAYNSKENYPLYCKLEDFSEYLVFDEEGHFTDEFAQFCNTL